MNAGHGINYQNITEIVQIPHLHELNIGHSIISPCTLSWDRAGGSRDACTSELGPIMVGVNMPATIVRQYFNRIWIDSGVIYDALRYSVGTGCSATW